MGEPLVDTWASRDLPVLKAICEMIEDPNTIWVSPPDIQRTLGLEPQQVQLALKNLLRGQYIEANQLASGDIHQISDVSADALREVGRWPTPEAGHERLLAYLEALIANPPDEDTRVRAQKILDALKSGSTSIGLGIAAGIITGQLPGQ